MLFNDNALQLNRANQAQPQSIGRFSKKLLADYPIQQHQATK
jgi:hypothetical protein